MFNRHTLLVMGHSHVECINAALQTRRDARDIRVVNLHKFEESGKPRDTIVAEIKRSLGRFKPKAVCLSLGGNLHNQIGLIENPIPFAVGHPREGSVPAPSQERTFIPHALLRDFTHARARPAMIALLYTMFPKTRRLYLNPPPPLGDFDYIRKHPGFFRGKLSLGPGPKDLRLYLYRIQTEVFQELATTQKAAFVTQDARVKTPDGFLLPEFFNNEPTHGNAAYGAIMLDKILEQARRAS